MNIYAFPLPGDPVIRPETRDEMIDRMAAEAMQWVREECAKLVAEYGTAYPAIEYDGTLSGMLGGMQWSDRQRQAILSMAASSNVYNFGGQLAHRSALSQFGLAQLQNML